MEKQKKKQMWSKTGKHNVTSVISKKSKDSKDTTNKQTGITLIALVISIIVMLILAGISLNMTVGENGIITKAQQAKLAQEDAEFNEQSQMILLEAWQMKDNGATDEEIGTYLKQSFLRLGTKVVASKIGEEWVILCDNRIVKSGLSGKDLVKSFRVDKVGTSEEWTVKYDEQGWITIIGSTYISGDLVIPEYITYKKEDGTEAIGKVKQIGNEGYNVFSYRSRITSIKFPEGLQIIYNNVFYECVGLKGEINFPSTLTTIGDYVFYNCDGLTGNIIEKLDNSNITSVGSYAFYGCSSLTGELKLFDKIDLKAMTFAGCKKITGNINILLIEGLTEIPDGAFSGMSGLTGTPNIPNTVTRIGNYAFYQCTELTGILTIPSVCTEIGDYAFYECSKFNYLSLDTSSNGKLGKIGECAFHRCGFKNDGLEFPNSLTSIEKNCFGLCGGLIGTLKFPSSITEIPTQAFASTGFTEIILPSSIKTLNGQCFANTKITSIDLSNVTDIGSITFENCRDLENVIFSNELTFIGGRCFKGCSSLTSLSFPNSLQKLEGSCFANCTSLQSFGTDNTSNVIDYLKSTYITSIGDGAFSNCALITGEFNGELTTKGGKCTVGGSPFLATGVTIVSAPLYKKIELLADGSYSIVDNAYAGATDISGILDLTNVTLEDGTKVTISRIGTRSFQNCSNIEKIILPETLTSIGWGGFYGCSSLETVNIPASLGMGMVNFSGCTSLKNINIEEGLTTIGYGAFQGCTSLESINIPDSVEKIGYAAFQNCELLTNVNFGQNSKLKSLENSIFWNCKSLEKITLPSGITEITDAMFGNCSSLEKVSFLGKIEKIGTQGFYNCTLLEKVDIPTLSNLMTIGDSAFKNCSNLSLDLRNLPTTCSIGKDAFTGAPNIKRP